MNLAELRQALREAQERHRDATTVIDRLTHLSAEGRTLTAGDEAELRQLEPQLDQALADAENLDVEIRSLERRIGVLETAASNGTARSGADTRPYTTAGRAGHDQTDWARGDLTASQTRSLVAAGIEAVAGLVGDTAAQAATLAAERIGDDDSPRLRHARATSSPDYLRAFIKATTGGQHAHFSDAERAALSAGRSEARAMQVGSDPSGGHLVPYVMDPTVHQEPSPLNPLRQLATTRTITSNEYRANSMSNVVAEWADELVEANDNAPTFNQRAIGTHKAHSFVPYSVEAEGDIPALAAELAEGFTAGKARLEAAAFMTGDGAGKPTGLMTRLNAAGAPTIVPAAAAGTLTANDVRKLWSELPAEHRAMAAWGLNAANAAAIQALGNGADADFTVHFDAEGFPRVIGKVEHELPNAPDDRIIFGDFTRYVIVDRVGMAVELIPHVMGPNNRPTGQRGLYAWWRTGGDLAPDAETAFRVLDLA